MVVAAAAVAAGTWAEAVVLISAVAAAPAWAVVASVAVHGWAEAISQPAQPCARALA
jgi:hypothetical protein